jgi:hypothetical protein
VIHEDSSEQRRNLWAAEQDRVYWTMEKTWDIRTRYGLNKKLTQYKNWVDIITKTKTTSKTTSWQSVCRKMTWVVFNGITIGLNVKENWGHLLAQIRTQKKKKNKVGDQNVTTIYTLYMHLLIELPIQASAPPPTHTHTHTLLDRWKFLSLIITYHI